MCRGPRYRMPGAPHALALHAVLGKHAATTYVIGMRMLAGACYRAPR
jgi:hypothetical protein